MRFIVIDHVRGFDQCLGAGWLLMDACIWSRRKLMFKSTGELKCRRLTLSRSCPSVRFSKAAISNSEDLAGASRRVDV